MKVVKKTKDYCIIKKKSGRYGVRSSGKFWVNGADKIAVLVKEGLIDAVIPKEDSLPEKGVTSENDKNSDNETKEEKESKQKDKTAKKKEDAKE